MTNHFAARMTAGHLAALVCQLEASIPKPGNVHRGADFDDMTLYDLLVSGQVLGQVIDETAEQPLSETIETAVQRTRQLMGKNTNLGIVLLLSPLAKVLQQRRPLTTAALGELLGQLNRNDSRAIYAAIRLAAPGGLGQSPQYDVSGDAPDDIQAAMAVAEARDDVARQWTHGFEDVIQWFAPRLMARRHEWGQLDRAVMAVHVEWIAERGDSLIARKCGEQTAQTGQRLAQIAAAELQRGWEAFEKSAAELDFWMRSDGHRRNPGTTADLIAAGLFVGFAQGCLSL